MDNTPPRKELYEITKAHTDVGITIVTCSGEKHRGYLYTPCNRDTVPKIREYIADHLALMTAQLKALESFEPKKILISSMVYSLLIPVTAKDVLEKAKQLLEDHPLWSLDHAIYQAKKTTGFVET